MLAAARIGLGAAYVTVWAAGQALPVDEAIALARQDLPAVAVGDRPASVVPALPPTPAGTAPPVYSNPDHH